jgi:hypothetical protein
LNFCEVFSSSVISFSIFDHLPLAGSNLVFSQLVRGDQKLRLLWRDFASGRQVGWIVDLPRSCGTVRW